MKRATFAALLLVVTLLLGGSPCPAGDPPLPVGPILAKWEEASQKCRTLDAKLTILQYTICRRDQPSVSHGRFYYEAPNLGRCEIREGGETKVNGWPASSELWIWRGDETLRIDESQRTCYRYVGKDLEELRADAERSSQTAAKNEKARSKAGFLQWLAEPWALISLYLQEMQSPQRCFPLLVDIRAADVEKRFDVTLVPHDGDVWLKALPKQRRDQRLYREVDVILDAKTHLTSAIRLIPAGGNAYTVVQLTETKVNQRPSDRDQLLNPDLSGLQVR